MHLAVTPVESINDELHQHLSKHCTSFGLLIPPTNWMVSPKVEKVARLSYLQLGSIGTDTLTTGTWHHHMQSFQSCHQMLSVLSTCRGGTCSSAYSPSRHVLLSVLMGGGTRQPRSIGFEIAPNGIWHQHIRLLGFFCIERSGAVQVFAQRGCEADGEQA